VTGLVVADHDLLMRVEEEERAAMIYGVDGSPDITNEERNA
jgi:hypothetical protein